MSDQLQSRHFFQLPGEIRNLIYGLWMEQEQDYRTLRHCQYRSGAFDLALLSTCRRIQEEADLMFYQRSTFYFPGLRLLYDFLTSRSVAQRKSILAIRFAYDDSPYAYDALDLMSSCTSLKRLEIDVPNLNQLKLDSPGIRCIRRMRRLNWVCIRGRRFYIDSTCRKTLIRELKLKRPLKMDQAWRREDRRHREKYSLEYVHSGRINRLKSLRSVSAYNSHSLDLPPSIVGRWVNSFWSNKLVWVAGERPPAMERPAREFKSTVGCETVSQHEKGGSAAEGILYRMP